jgi:protein arginine kinase
MCRQVGMTERRGCRMSLESDVTISSRVRIARNLEGLPFPFKLDGEMRREVINRIKKTLIEKKLLNIKFNYIDMGTIEPINKQSLFEKHLISLDFLKDNRPSGLLTTEDEKISIMVNEEDHLRIQCIFPGFDLFNSMKLCMDVESMLEKEHAFSFNRKYGYLTTCPTNIGTGLRASVMLHLPALVMTGYINNVIQNVLQLGLTARGMYGENSQALGNMFQISNQKTMGQSEESLVNNVNNIAGQIIQQEKNIRQQMYMQNKYKFEDKVLRALGILENARVISSDESLKLLSDVRLGLDMGLIKDISKDQLNDLFVMIQPGSLQKVVDKDIDPQERDIQRARVIRRVLGKV